MFGIRKAIGLGIAIVVLKLLMAVTFTAFEGTLQTFLHTADHGFRTLDHVIGAADTKIPQ